MARAPHHQMTLQTQALSPPLHCGSKPRTDGPESCNLQTQGKALEIVSPVYWHKSSWLDLRRCRFESYSQQSTILFVCALFSVCSSVANIHARKCFCLRPWHTYVFISVTHTRARIEVMHLLFCSQLSQLIVTGAQLDHKEIPQSHRRVEDTFQT